MKRVGLDYQTQKLVKPDISFCAISGYGVAIDVHHWVNDREFTDMFAISRLSPGPSVLIVILIGYSVAGILGALAATLAMCGPTAILAYYVSGFLRRSSGSRWPAVIQAALVPLSIGLLGASALILALTSDRNWAAALLTIVAAALAFATKLNPFWIVAAAQQRILVDNPARPYGFGGEK
jgi:chromate transporter